MLIIVYQTNTGHQAVGLYNESNAQNKLTFKYWSCHAVNVVHQLSSFLRTLLCNLPRWSCTFDTCLANIFLKSLTNIFCLLPSLFTSTISVPRGPLSGHFLHLKHFEASASLFVVNGILLNIALNLWHSRVLQSQTSNFPNSLKRSGSCVKLFSLKNFMLSLNEAPKAHKFCFLLLIQRYAVQRKSNKATLPNTKNFFNCKTRVVRIIAMFIASH